MCTVDSDELADFSFARGPQRVMQTSPAQQSAAPEPPRRSSATQLCAIKGNISVKTGERIYHVPGQEYYEQTVINEAYGERWFCTEREARAAGWRKSRA
ncbi:hypothetical protein G7070_13450 [Propioniciclava coleopterorum]|uniref:Uncharacterized protein n=1 Tax=Propioniciclava coleopterorum TaxID=2714937 RepID=A0A6G7Y867_9ACTN|nr:hypothetical protein G7070_13450 [Propioniciclava coleopterorum]